MTRALVHLWKARPFRNAFLLRGLLAWWVVRMGTTAAKIGLGLPPVSVLVVVIASLLVWFDAHRRNEDLFLGNLGIPIAAILMTGALPALIVETALQLLVTR